MKIQNLMGRTAAIPCDPAIVLKAKESADITHEQLKAAEKNQSFKGALDSGRFVIVQDKPKRARRFNGI